MRKWMLAAAAAVAATVFAWPAAGGSPPGPAQDRVYGGGSITPGSCTDGSTPFCSGASRDISILAVSSPGGGGAYGTVRFQTGTARVTCLAISGNVAEIGGVVTESSVPEALGDEFRVFVRDGGTPGSGADGISPSFFDTPAQATCGDVGSDALGSGYFALTHGDLAVENH